ncbi:MAG: hypothetical protein AW07_04094 [Candidatus Accumulibacter sp. SK-11]|nr:MAG: hypothetical protein AW07_04094 [Candidatus Accumulibacter sp. SK-11]
MRGSSTSFKQLIRLAAGHGRTLASHLPAQVETIELDSPHCPDRGLGARPRQRYTGEPVRAYVPLADR